MGLVTAFIFLGILTAQSGNTLHAPTAENHDPIDFRSRCNIVLSHNPQARKRPLLVILPGGPGFSSHTVPVQGLSEEYDVCFLNPAGTGGTLPLKNRTLENLISDVEKTLANYNRETILVGHSFGGILGAELALRKKLRVKSLVFLGSPLSSTSLGSVEAGLNKFGDTHPEVKKIKMRFETHPEDPSTLVSFVKAARERYFSTGKVDAGIQMLDGEKADGLLLQVFSELKPFIDSLPERLKTLKIPITHIASRDDQVVPYSAVQEDAKRAGNIRIEETEGAHFFPFEKPELTGRLILKALQK